MIFLFHQTLVQQPSFNESRRIQLEYGNNWEGFCTSIKGAK